MLIFILLVLWLGGGAWGARRAVKAGYSELVATLAAIFLGPFAPLLALAKPLGKRCAFCLSVMPEQAIVCSKCAREQPPPAPPVVKASPEEIKAGLEAARVAAQEAAKAAQAAERAKVRERIAADNAENQRLAQERLDALTRKSG